MRLYMKKILLLIIIFLSIASPSFATTASSCSLADVRTAVTATARGGTVTVPAGSCNWNDTLTVPKAITIQGAGTSNCTSGTCITSTFSANGKTKADPFIKYEPTSSDVSTLFRVTGFRFDCANYTPVLRGTNSRSSYVIRKVRFDNNRVTNTICQTSASYYSRPIFFLGNMAAVVDSNYIQGATHSVDLYRGARTAWDSSLWDGWDNGTEDNLFVEDNYFVASTYAQIGAVSAGGSNVVRYNTFDYSSAPGWFYTWDTHGNQPGPSYGGFGMEYYGNKIIPPSGASCRIVDHRGGIGKFFYNGFIGSGSAEIRVATPYGADMDCPGGTAMDGVSNCATTSTKCPASGLYGSNQTAYFCAVDGRTSNPEKTYIWNNKKGTTTPSTEVTTNVCYGGGVESSGYCGTVYPAPSVTGAKASREGYEYWDLDMTHCESGGACTAGIGCGTTLPTSCTVGTAFWLTQQSCTTVPLTLIGQSHTDKIAGKLYKCTDNSPVTWTQIYTPYTYPHPLREDPDDPTGDGWQCTVSRTGDGCMITGSQVVEDGNTCSATVTLRNGWKATWGGTCPAGSESGGIYTTGNLSADCTLTAACTEQGILP